MFSFTKKKFLNLELKARHKKCSEILRFIYEKLLLKQYITHLFKEYNELLSWMDIKDFISNDIKEISNQYHFHLKLAKINLKEHNLLPTLTSLDGKREQKDFLDVCIYLDNLRSAYNVGNIIRTTEALRIGTIYFSKNTPFIDNEKVQKTSMASYKFAKCKNSFDIKNLPRPFIGLDTSKKSTPIYDFIFPEKFTLVLGNEEVGISNEMLKELDYIIEIPMLGFKNSINVASAYAIAASKIRKELS
ncbi:MAG: tRNA (guanosine(18)-2'-O)-methyltransferase [Candidatus Anoxychlamydiales bacterium]|nr:tRNA (guanosine(18)-2'-O)-methyltransferase [Candidatus Anoxychlamydiales bacterium]